MLMLNGFELYETEVENGRRETVGRKRMTSVGIRSSSKLFRTSYRALERHLIGSTQGRRAVPCIGLRGKLFREAEKARLWRKFSAPHEKSEVELP